MNSINPTIYIAGTGQVLLPCGKRKVEEDDKVRKVAYVSFKATDDFWYSLKVHLNQKIHYHKTLEIESIGICHVKNLVTLVKIGCRQDASVLMDVIKVCEEQDFFKKFEDSIYYPKTILQIIAGRFYELSKELQKNNSLASIRDLQGVSPFQWAVLLKQIEFIRILAPLDNAYYPTVKESPFGMALFKGYYEIGNEILNCSGKGLELNKLDSCGKNLMHYATVEKNLEAIKYLVSVGVNINAVDKNDNSPLCWGVDNGDLKFVEFLMSLGADPNCFIDPLKSPLYLAVIKTRTDIIVQLLVVADPNILILPDIYLISYIKMRRLMNWQNISKAFRESFIYKNRAAELAAIKVHHAKWKNLKMVAHALNLKGASMSHKISIPWEGSYPEKSLRVFQKSLALFHKKFPDKIPQTFFDIVFNTLEMSQNIFNTSLDLVMGQYDLNKIIIITSGYINHAVFVFIGFGYFVISNLGKHNRGGIEIYPFKRTITRELVQEFLDLKSDTEEKYIEKMNNGNNSSLLNKLGISLENRESSLEKLVDLPLQTVGNCSWTSLEGVFKTALLLYYYQEDENKAIIKSKVDKVFNSWKLFHVINVLNKNLDYHVTSSNKYEKNFLEKSFTAYTQLMEMKPLEADLIEEAEKLKFKLKKILDTLTHLS